MNRVLDYLMQRIGEHVDDLENRLDRLEREAMIEKHISEFSDRVRSSVTKAKTNV